MADRFDYKKLVPHDEMLGLADVQYTLEEIERTSYRPTIVIGLGGTGYSVVQKLKRRIRAHYGPERERVFQYIVFDTAPETAPSDEPPLGEGEFVYLKSFPANRMIQQLREGDPIQKWWMAPHIPNFTGNGAGAIRSVGRLVLFRYANSLIVPRLRSKIRAAVDIAAQQGRGPRSIKIYVVCSIAGGTGSSQYLDFAYLARNEVMRQFPGDTFLTGILVMPSAFVPFAKAPIEKQRFQANGYAALRELDLLNATKNFDVDYGGGLHVGELTSGLRPFNIAYLISLFNENNQALGGFESLTEMIAEEMMLEIASPLQGQVNNILDNIQETSFTIEGHPTAYSSFSVSSLLYPLRGVASWCALKYEVPFIREVLLQPIKSPEDAEHEADAFLDEMELREEGADQVVNALNKDLHGHDLATTPLDYGQFQGIPDADLLNALQREEPSGTDSLTNIKKQIEERLRELQADKPRRIRRKLNALARDPERGSVFAEWFLSAFEAKMRAYRKEQMLAEQEGYQRQLTNAQNALEATRQEVERAVGMPAFVPLRRLRQKVDTHISTFNSTLNFEHQAVLREKAVKLYTTILDTVSVLSHQVKELNATWRKEAESAEIIAEQARVRLKVTQAEFSLVKSVVNERELIETYHKYKPSHESPEERHALLADFWIFFAERAPDWELGRNEVVPEGESAQPFYYLGEIIGAKLAAMPLLTRMEKELALGSDRRARELWLNQVRERYTQAAPFWNVSITRFVSEIDRHLRRSPNLIGYGENNLEVHWSDKFGEGLGEEINAVQTKNDQEIVFLKTAHGLPLLAVHEVEAELKPSYDLLQHEWQDGGREFPVHSSAEWEAQVIERDHKLSAPATPPTPPSGSPAKPGKPGHKANGHLNDKKAERGLVQK